MYLSILPRPYGTRKNTFATRKISARIISALLLFQQSTVESDKYSIFSPEVLNTLLERCEKTLASFDDILAFLYDKVCRMMH
jgi:hypothetical protein